MSRWVRSSRLPNVASGIPGREPKDGRKDSSSPGGWRGRGKLSRYIAAAHEGSEDCRLGARAIFVTDVQPSNQSRVFRSAIRASLAKKATVATWSARTTARALKNSVISLQALDFRMSLIFWRDKLWPQSLAEIGLPHVAISSGPFLWVIAIKRPLLLLSNMVGDGPQ